MFSEAEINKIKMSKQQFAKISCMFFVIAIMVTSVSVAAQTPSQSVLLSISVERKPGESASDSYSTSKILAKPRSAPSNGNVGQHEFGTVSGLDTPHVSQDFFLHNDSASPVTVTQLKPSCACTTATIELDGPQAARAAAPTPAGTASPLMLAPGQRAVVHVTVNLVNHAPGVFHKTVSVFAQGVLQPVALLEMQGTLLSAVSLSPPLLDFGKASALAARSQTLTATVDARLLPDGRVPELVSSDPAVRIAPGAPTEAVPSTPGQPKTLTRTYTVTVAPAAPLGPLSATLSFAPVGGQAPSASPPAAPTSPLSSDYVSATAVGQVTGDVTASPAVLSYGNVFAGTPQERTVTLTGETAKALTALKAECDSPWVTARIGTGSDAATGQALPYRPLTLTLSPQTPPGVLEAKVTVHLDSGQRLILPVTAFVRAALPGATASTGTKAAVGATHP